MTELESLRPFATTAELRVLDAIVAAGSHRKAARQLGYSKGSISNAIGRLRRRAEKRGWSPGFDQTHPCPPSQYIKGVSTMYDSGGNIATQWVKTNARQEEATEALKAFAEELSESIGTARPRLKLPKIATDDLAVHYKAGDHHFGMYSWAAETGADWDLRKSVATFCGAVNHLVNAAPAARHGVFVNVGDLSHINDRKNATPASGNLLDVDSRFPKVARACEQGLLYAVNRLLDKHEHVRLINARGNHDPDLAVLVSMLLKAHYKNEPRVTVEDSADYWQTWEFGETVVFVNHGERKRQQQHEYLSRRFGRLWGKRHKYVDNGHIHHRQAEEIGGVHFESWNVLPPPDEYHTRSAYGASRSMSSVTYHREHGEVGRSRCDIGLIEAELERKPRKGK